jgi:large subunit ribosomal protein L17
MRHGDKINNLGRTTAHRKALLSNLACQLIQYKRITTTLAKAKSLRMYVEPMITKSKSDTVNNRRLVFAKLQDKEAIKELFGAVSDKVASRPGGYTRIIKLAPRIGDAAEMAMIELVDFNTIYTKDAKAGTAKKTRRSRGGATKTAAPKAETTTVATEETPATEAPEQAKEEGAE